MAKAGYTVVSGAAVSLTATTAKSVLGVRAGDSFGIDLKKIRFGVLGTDATDVPGVVELCRATFVTNAPGTASTDVTPAQVYGRAITHGATAARNWTSEPTVLTVVDEWAVTPNSSLVLYDLPLGDTPDCDLDHGFVLRATFPDAVSVRAALWWERC